MKRFLPPLPFTATLLLLRLLLCQRVNCYLRVLQRLPGLDDDYDHQSVIIISFFRLHQHNHSRPTLAVVGRVFQEHPSTNYLAAFSRIMHYYMTV